MPLMTPSQNVSPVQLFVSRFRLGYSGLEGCWIHLHLVGFKVPNPLTLV